MPTRATGSRTSERRSLTTRSVPMLPEPTTATGIRASRRPHANRTATAPSRSKRARNAVPGRAGTDACSAPGMTTWPASSVTPSSAQRFGSPGDRGDRVAQAGRPGTGGHDLAVLLERHTDEPQVERRRSGHGRRRHDARRTGHVRHGVERASFQSAMRESMTSMAGGDRRRRATDVVGRDTGARNGAAQDERDLGLDPRRDQPAASTVPPSGTTPADRIGP